jgi:peptidoglycan/xylan/chitin deacetylase (PgdA/CDA1 family)
MKLKIVLFIVSWIIAVGLIASMPFAGRLLAKSRPNGSIGYLNSSIITSSELGISKETSSEKTYNTQPSVTQETTVNSKERTIPQKTQKSIAILAYHHVGEGKYSDWTVIDEVFAQQMKTLYESGYRTITVKDLLEHHYKGVTIPQNSFVLTFDDGYQTMYTVVLPILDQYDFKATFFIPTNFIKDQEKNRMTNTWDTEDQLNFPKYHMIWSEVKALSDDGHEIASHGLNHIPLGSDLIADEIFENEINDSKKEIEIRLGVEVYSFAYPGTSYSQKAIEYLKDHDYFGAVIGGDINVDLLDFNPYLLPRFYIKREVTIEDILSYVKSPE